MSPWAADIRYAWRALTGPRRKPARIRAYAGFDRGDVASSRLTSGSSRQ